MRRKAALALKLRGEGASNEDIAKELGYTNVHSVSDLLYYAGKHGWFITPDVDAHLTYVTTHKIVKNIDTQLDGADLTEQQMAMTIAAARGRGLFKRHDAENTAKTETPALVGVKIEIINRDQAGPIREGTIGGTPNYLEGETA